MNKIINILENIDSFELGLKNPRFQLIFHLVKEPWECFLMRERHKNQIFDLIEDILKEKLFENNFMVKRESEKWIVLDGNRRIFALKILFSEKFRNKIKIFDEIFYQKIKKLISKYQSNFETIKENLGKSVITVYQSELEIKKALERKHAENQLKNGKFQTKWGTWETKINQNEATAVYLHSLLKKIDFEIFVEKIDQKPTISWTVARDMLTNSKSKAWLNIIKKDGKYESTDEKDTLKKIQYVLHYRLKNPKKTSIDFFSGWHAEKTIESIQKNYSTNEEKGVFDELLNHKKELENYNSFKIVNNNQTNDTKKRNQKENIYLKNIYSLTKNENSKLGVLIKTIHELSQKQMKKYRFLVGISLRTIVELLTRRYFEMIKGEHISYKNQKTISKQITEIIEHMKNNFDLKKFDFVSIENFVSKTSNKMSHLISLQEFMHSNSEFLFEDLEMKLRIVDNICSSIFNVIKNQNIYRKNNNKIIN